MVSINWEELTRDDFHDFAEDSAVISLVPKVKNNLYEVLFCRPSSSFLRPKLYRILQTFQLRMSPFHFAASRDSIITAVLYYLCSQD